MTGTDYRGLPEGQGSITMMCLVRNPNGEEFTYFEDLRITADVDLNNALDDPIISDAFVVHEGLLRNRMRVQNAIRKGEDWRG